MPFSAKNSRQYRVAVIVSNIVDSIIKAVYACRSDLAPYRLASLIGQGSCRRKSFLVGGSSKLYDMGV